MNNWEYVKAGLALLAAIAEVKPGSFAEVEMPE
jgi:hypothetical protein